MPTTNDAADNGIRVVVAEEHLLFMEALRLTLEREPGFEVVGVAADGVEAIAQTTRHRPDVVILAHHLPGCDGVQAASLIRERAPESRIVFLSETEDHPTLVAALEAGATGYLSKRCALEELIDATRAVSRGEVLIPRGMLAPLLNELIHRRRQQQAGRRLLLRLTPRERQVLGLLSAGKNNEDIAAALVISPQTARTHVQNVLTKLGIHSRLAAAAFANRDGMFEALEELQREEIERPTRRQASRGEEDLELSALSGKHRESVWS